MEEMVRLGCGSGWARDRLDHVSDLIHYGHIDYLCFDTMSEITMSATVALRNASWI